MHKTVYRPRQGEVNLLNMLIIYAVIAVVENILLMRNSYSVLAQRDAQIMVRCPREGKVNLLSTSATSTVVAVAENILLSPDEKSIFYPCAVRRAGPQDTSHHPRRGIECVNQLNTSNIPVVANLMTDIDIRQPSIRS